MPVSAVLNFKGYCGRHFPAPELMKARWGLLDLRQEGKLSSEALAEAADEADMVFSDVAVWRWYAARALCSPHRSRPALTLG
jgi:hypothetical protein